MALNGFFDSTVLYNDIDITEYCSLDSFIVSDRNLDYTQNFSKQNLKISLLIGCAYLVKKNDVFKIAIQDNLHIYTASEIKYTDTHVQVQLTSEFESLKDKRFLTLNDSQDYIPNPLLDSFLDGSNLIIENNMHTLLAMICTLAIGETATITEDSFTRSYHYDTKFSVGIPDVFRQDISINEDFLLWANENSVEPAELLEILQKIYCFTIKVDNTDSTNFIVKSLPVMKVVSDYTFDTNKYYDPEFFNLATIQSELNPVLELDSTYYSEKPTFIEKKKEAMKILDSTTTFFEYEYRKDLDITEIEVPDNLDLSHVFTPLKFSKDGSKYTLKAGYYHAYYRYFSYYDIIQDTSVKLNYQIPTGYYKTEYKFTGESGFSDIKNARKCTFNNKDFSISLIDNRIVEKNSIRG
jgi:hypothetical protein